MSRALLPVLLPLALLAACATRAQGDRPVVVASVAPIVDIVYNVGCDRVELVQTVPDGADSHTYRPPPSVVKDVARADLIVLNGLHLELPMLELAEANRKAEAPVLLLGDNTITRDEWVFDFSFPQEEGDPNPHLWPNPVHVMRYTELVRDALVQVDPANADVYRQNAERFIGRLRELDQAIARVAETIPPQQRKLLTYHDSWAYFAPRYGFTVIGAVQPSDFSQPSPREVTALIEQIREAGVPAIFGSEVYPSDVMEQIARETGARYVTDLSDDDLPGDAGDPLHSYIGMMVENMRALAAGLGGDASAVDDVDTVSVCGRNR